MTDSFDTIIIRDFNVTMSLPKVGNTIMNVWDVKNIFTKSLEQTKKCDEFVFYDGPPFATGLPHYGHLLASFLKDTMGRYQTQNKKYVSRRFGWDCHGLPIEHEVNKMVGYEKAKTLPINEYNDLCRGIVNKYSKEWRGTMNAIGRWVDMDDDYKTMDIDFMNSLWYVHSELFKRGFISQQFKIMRHSTTLETTISNSEADNYIEISERTIIAKMRVVDSDEYLLIWTTTPWTLPSNLGVCVNDNIDYVLIHDTVRDEKYWVAETCLSILYGKKKKNHKYTLIKKIKGLELVGTNYEPLFPYFSHLKNDTPQLFTVISDNYVSDSSGTGLVHIAPGFGEDDFRVCVKFGLISREGRNLVCPMGKNGVFNDTVGAYSGKFYRDCIEDIVSELKTRKLVVKAEMIEHRVAVCPRSDTPLVFMPSKGWFIDAPRIKEKMMELNKDVRWVPEHVGKTRFNNWLSTTRDWNYSRTRVWGTPIPIWVSDDGKEMYVVGSKEELEKLTGTEIKDLHRDHIDHLTFEINGKTLRRIPEVFDCWFESGSMPFAQNGYPYKTDQLPRVADFIAEGLDQTRGWFYTLLVIFTAIRGESPYKNVIVNGIVCAEDGKKMSKRLRNYPDPNEIINELGADPVRMYMICSPASHGENLNFSKNEVIKMNGSVFIPLYNGLKFFLEYTNVFHDKGMNVCDYLGYEPKNFMDKWFLSSVNILADKIKKSMDKYELFKIGPELVKFVDRMNNVYIKLNRNRFKCKHGDIEDTGVCLATCYKVMKTFAVISAPFMPFFSEFMYQNISDKVPVYRKESVHLEFYDENTNYESINEDIDNVVNKMITIIEKIRMMRTKVNLSMRKPIKYIRLGSFDDISKSFSDVTEYIKHECNSFEIEFVILTNDNVKYNIIIDRKMCGKTLKRKSGGFSKYVQSLSQEDIIELNKNEKIIFDDIELVKDTHYSVIKSVVTEDKKYEESEYDMSLGLMIGMCTIQDKQTEAYFMARTFVTKIQQSRKDAGLHPWNKINIYYEFYSFDINDLVKDGWSYIMDTIEYPVKSVDEIDNPDENKIFEKVYNLFEDDSDEMKVRIILYKQ